MEYAMNRDRFCILMENYILHTFWTRMNNLLSTHVNKISTRAPCNGGVENTSRKHLTFYSRFVPFLIVI